MLSATYTNTIKTPYKMALNMPPFSLVFPSFLVKKLTVNGIIGNTQGVSSASNPPKNPNPKITINSFIIYLYLFDIKSLTNLC